MGYNALCHMLHRYKKNPEDRGRHSPKRGQLFTRMDTASQPRSRNRQTHVRRPNFAKLFLPQPSHALFIFRKYVFPRDTSSEVIWYKSGVPTLSSHKKQNVEEWNFIWIRLVHTARYVLNYGCPLVILCSNVLTNWRTCHEVGNLIRNFSSQIPASFYYTNHAFI